MFDNIFATLQTGLSKLGETSGARTKVEQDHIDTIFDALKATVDKKKARAYLEAVEGRSIIPPKVPMKTDKLLRDFILQGGFDIELPDADT